jgi:hypothetical protein
MNLLNMPVYVYFVQKMHKNATNSSVSSLQLQNHRCCESGLKRVR